MYIAANVLEADIKLESCSDQRGVVLDAEKFGRRENSSPPPWNIPTCEVNHSINVVALPENEANATYVSDT